MLENSLVVSATLSAAFLATFVLGEDSKDKTVSAIEGKAPAAIVDRKAYYDWRSGFERVSDARLRKLAISSEDSTALTAAWERYVRRPASKRAGDGRVTEVESASFCAFVEGRLHIAIPDWYRTALEAGRVNDAPRAMQFGSWPAPKDLAVDVSPKVKTIVGNKIEHAAGRLSFRDSAKVLTLTEKETRGILENAVGVVYRREADDFWIATYDEPYMHELLCYKSDGTRQWQSEIWTRPKYPTSGEYFHLPAVLTQGERVYVVGIGSGGTHIEGFEKKTGTPMVRFLSSHESIQE